MILYLGDYKKLGDKVYGSFKYYIYIFCCIKWLEMRLYFKGEDVYLVLLFYIYLNF